MVIAGAFVVFRAFEWEYVISGRRCRSKEGRGGWRRKCFVRRREDVDEAADKSQKSKKTRPRCEYRESLFDGNPPIPIANSKALNAQVRGLLAKSAHGDRDVRLKPVERANSIAVVGECSKQSQLATDGNSVVAGGWHTVAKSQMSWQAWKKVSTKRLQDVGTCRNCRDQDGAPKRNAAQQPQCERL